MGRLAPWAQADGLTFQSSLHRGGHGGLRDSWGDLLLRRPTVARWGLSRCGSSSDLCSCCEEGRRRVTTASTPDHGPDVRQPRATLAREGRTVDATATRRDPGLFGREHELAALVGAGSRIHGVQVCVVTGPPGSGKTRLIREAAVRIRPSRTFTVTGYEPERAVRLAAASDLIRSLSETARVPALSELLAALDPLAGPGDIHRRRGARCRGRPPLDSRHVEPLGEQMVTTRCPRSAPAILRRSPPRPPLPRSPGAGSIWPCARTGWSTRP